MESPLPSVAKAFTAKGGQTDTPLYRYEERIGGVHAFILGDPLVGTIGFIDFLYGEAPDCSR